MPLLGIFYSVDKPVMGMYLRPIVDELLHLLREGCMLAHTQITDCNPFLWYV